MLRHCYSLGVPASLALAALLACARLEPRRDRAASSRDSGVLAQIGACPASKISTIGWREVRTADGRVRLLLPPTYRPIQTDHPELWGFEGGSWSYAVIDSSREQREDDAGPRPSDSSWCTALIDGRPTAVRYGYAAGVAGRGYYLQARLPVGRGATASLIGFIRDSADGTRLLAIATSVRVLTN